MTCFMVPAPVSTASEAHAPRRQKGPSHSLGRKAGQGRLHPGITRSTALRRHAVRNEADDLWDQSLRGGAHVGEGEVSGLSRAYGTRAKPAPAVRRKQRWFTPSPSSRRRAARTRPVSRLLVLAEGEVEKTAGEGVLAREVWWPQRDTNPLVLWNSAGLYMLPSSPGSVSPIVGRRFRSGARNRLQANRSLGFCL
jgi:hypothetical protein